MHIVGSRGVSMTTQCDLLIVGGGPAGMALAINSGSEGVDVKLLDSGPLLGGQAVQSSMIENYAGFPDGVTGSDLMFRCVKQAQKFGVDALCPETAATIRRDGDFALVTTDHGNEYAAKAVILAIGLSYRTLPARGLVPLFGRGVLYGQPTGTTAFENCKIFVVGGANSAGQAAVHFSKNPQTSVTILIRKRITDQMSEYLINRLKAAPNVTIMEHVEVMEVAGVNKLEQIVVRKADKSLQTLPADHMFIYIGAQPKTFWLNGTIAMDKRKFILTGPKLVGMNLWKGGDRQPLPFETCEPGVFACGDVRLGSTKRVTSAMGEAVGALQSFYEYMDLLNGGSTS